MGRRGTGLISEKEKGTTIIINLPFKKKSHIKRIFGRREFNVISSNGSKRLFCSRIIWNYARHLVSVINNSDRYIVVGDYDDAVDVS